MAAEIWRTHHCDSADNESNVDDDANWMSTSVVMQVGELKGEWDLEAEEEQASIDVCDISEAEITVGQIQGSLHTSRNF